MPERVGGKNTGGRNTQQTGGYGLARITKPTSAQQVKYVGITKIVIKKSIVSDLEAKEPGI